MAQNHFLQEYGRNEQSEFVGFMPKVAELVGEVGSSDVVVSMYEGYNGHDAMTAADFPGVLNETEDSGETSGSTGGETSGDTGEEISGTTGGETSGDTGEEISGTTGI